VPELLPPRLVLVATHAGGELGESFAIDFDGALQLARHRLVTRRNRELATERFDVADVSRERERSLTFERHPRDFGGDVRIAVAIASDPASVSEERTNRERFTGKTASDRLFELPVDRRRHLQQRSLEHVKDRTNLVERARTDRACFLGRIERGDG